jgi:hypothetical protein
MSGWGGLPMRFSDITFGVLNRFQNFLEINARTECPQVSYHPQCMVRGRNVEKSVLSWPKISLSHKKRFFVQDHPFFKKSAK